MKKCFAIAAAAALAAASTLSASELWGITGDGANTPETLFTIDITNASITFQVALGNGADGEALGFNPNNGLLYHMSGISDGDEYFETVNPNTLGVGPNLASGNTYGNGGLGEFTAIEWYQPLGVFLASNRRSNLFHVGTDGTFTDVGTTNYMRGLGIVGNRVFGIDPSGTNLWEVNPNDGSIINTLTVTLNGAATSGTGLAVDPDTGIMYAILKSASGGTRELAMLDYNTGAGTSIGVLDEKFAGITFIPAPSTLALLGLGGLAATRRRRRL